MSTGLRSPSGLASLLIVMTLAGCYGSMRSTADAPLSAGGLTPNVADKDVGLVALAPGFDVKQYRVVAVERMKVTDAVIKDDDDRKLADSMSAFFQTELVRRLRESGQFGRVVNLTETEFRPGAEKALRLEGDITRLGAGSQAARAMAGLYGAGRARAQADMRLVDAESGTVMAVVADRRIAQLGLFGGDSKDLLKESFDDMARDLARFLDRLSKGQAPATDGQKSAR
jgi:hypothetical protein